MGAKIIVTFEGLEQAIARLAEIEEKAPENLATLTKSFASEAKQAWQDETHQRTGRLRGGEEAETSGLSFVLKNAVYYYDFVDQGHWTPRGWHTRRGYRLAKRRTHVEGQEMTQKVAKFIEENLSNTLSHFLDNL